MASIINIDFNNPDDTQEKIKNIRQALASGEAIAFPTDTFYGLGVDPFNEKAVQALYRIKNRPADKPILVLVDTLGGLEGLTEEISPVAKKLMENLWPGPLTLLMRVSPHLPALLTAGTGRIGVRLPANAFTRQLISALGHPLTAPSANPSGGENPLTAGEVERALGSKLQWIVDGGPCPGGKTSTVLDTTVTPPALVRAGAVSREAIESILNVACA